MKIYKNCMDNWCENFEKSFKNIIKKFYIYWRNCGNFRNFSSKYGVFNEKMYVEKIKRLRGNLNKI